MTRDQGQTPTSGGAGAAVCKTADFRSLKAAAALPLPGKFHGVQLVKAIHWRQCQIRGPSRETGKLGGVTVGLYPTDHAAARAWDVARAWQAEHGQLDFSFANADFNFPGAGYEDDAELRKVLSQLPDLQAAAGHIRRHLVVPPALPDELRAKQQEARGAGPSPMATRIRAPTPAQRSRGQALVMINLSAASFKSKRALVKEWMITVIRAWNSAGSASHAPARAGGPAAAAGEPVNWREEERRAYGTDCGKDGSDGEEEEANIVGEASKNEDSEEAEEAEGEEEGSRSLGGPGRRGGRTSTQWRHRPVPPPLHLRAPSGTVYVVSMNSSGKDGFALAWRELQPLLTELEPLAGDALLLSPAGTSTGTSSSGGLFRADVHLYKAGQALPLPAPPVQQQEQQQQQCLQEQQQQQQQQQPQQQQRQQPQQDTPEEQEQGRLGSMKEKQCQAGEGKQHGEDANGQPTQRPQERKALGAAQPGKRKTSNAAAAGATDSPPSAAATGQRRCSRLQAATAAACSPEPAEAAEECVEALPSSTIQGSCAAHTRKRKQPEPGQAVERAGQPLPHKRPAALLEHNSAGGEAAIAAGPDRVQDHERPAQGDAQCGPLGTAADGAQTAPEQGMAQPEPRAPQKSGNHASDAPATPQSDAQRAVQSLGTSEPEAATAAEAAAAAQAASGSAEAEPAVALPLAARLRRQPSRAPTFPYALALAERLDAMAADCSSPEDWLVKMPAWKVGRPPVPTETGQYAAVAPSCAAAVPPAATAGPACASAPPAAVLAPAPATCPQARSSFRAKLDKILRAAISQAGPAPSLAGTRSSQGGPRAAGQRPFAGGSSGQRQHRFPGSAPTNAQWEQQQKQQVPAEPAQRLGGQRAQQQAAALVPVVQAQAPMAGGHSKKLLQQPLPSQPQPEVINLTLDSGDEGLAQQGEEDGDQDDEIEIM